MQLLSHLWQVACPNVSHQYDATSYLIDTGEGLILIDCGTPDGYRKIIENIKKTGHDPKNITVIYGTHGHYDHVGAAALFAAEYGVPLKLHKLDEEQVALGDDVRTTASILYNAHFPPAKVSGYVCDGQEIVYPLCKLRVLHTPGHTAGGVCYVLEMDGLSVLIAGDTLWGGFSEKIGSDEQKWRQSLDRLCAIHFDLLTFGHTAPVLFGDADARLREARSQFAVYYNPWFKAPSENYHY